MFKLFIRTNRLTDGSETFDVVLRDLEEGSATSRAVMDFGAITFDDAMNLCFAIRDAVTDHTNDEIEIVET